MIGLDISRVERRDRCISIEMHIKQASDIIYRVLTHDVPTYHNLRAGYQWIYLAVEQSSMLADDGAKQYQEFG